jgi:hypothetical protein
LQARSRSHLRIEFNGDFRHNHPAVISERLEEVEEFARVWLLDSACEVVLTIAAQALHTEVLDPLFVLLAVALELPEDYFTKIHQYPVKSEVRLSSTAAAFE